MPAWPGGPCPSCGEHVPEKVIHCVSCRTLLNADLDSPDIELPVFEPLKELSSLIEFSPTSYTFAIVAEGRTDLFARKAKLTSQCKLFAHCVLTPTADSPARDARLIATTIPPVRRHKICPS